MIEVGTMNIPSSATTNVLPLKSTARLAVAPATRDRVVLGEPVRALLAVARDDEQRVVDPEREPHPREHVHDEDRELELEREDRDEAERDDDREDRHQHGHEPGDDGAEDEHEDDERGRQAEGELALLEVLLRLLAEVVVRRAVAGDARPRTRLAFACSTTFSTGAAPESLVMSSETSAECRSGDTAAGVGLLTWPVAWSSAASRFANVRN